MTLQLRRHDTGYQYETSLRPRGIASWISRGAITESTTLQDIDGKLRPLDYVSTDTIARPARSTRYSFNEEENTVSGQYKTNDINSPLIVGGHNRISAHIAIIQALLNEKSIRRFQIFDRGRWKQYEFDVAGVRPVETPSGEFEAMEIQYASGNQEKSWSLFCAESLDYLPVIIVIRERGKVKSRALLTDYRIDSAN